LYGINPFNKKKIPIWISNHVSNLHGTGCVLGVPAHDFDDFLFSKKNNLKIIPIINKNYSSYENEPYTNNGILFNSGFLNKKSSVFSKHLMFKFLKKSRLGKKKTFYRLRDWLFSRQRYWGEPFPIIYIKKKPVIISEENLPIILPKIQDYELKNGKPPLSKAKKWASVRIDNKFGVRELNTMPQWAGSCWYYLRFIDSKNNKKLFSSKLEKYFMPVDLYVGGVEHAVLHLLYARFWHKVLYDCKIVSTKEPFLKLFNQGMILSNSFKDKNGKYYDKENIYFVDKKCYSKEKKLKINVFIEKMSKSKNNIINPDEIIDKYGADTLRMYELFMGPLDQTQIWNMSGLNGIYRFLNKIWNLFTSDQIKILNDQSVNKKNEFIKIHHVMNKAIKKITNDTLLLKFNTAISELMIFFNKIKLLRSIPFLIVLNFLKILYPYAPHISEELWEKLGNKSILSNLTWPIFKINRISDKKTIILQINGKKKEILKNLIFLNNDDLKNQALESLYVKKYINIKNVKNIFFIKEKIINIIIN
jgi:leucyl-tRNA synthetase